jgi:hypothetical protein
MLMLKSMFIFRRMSHMWSNLWLMLNADALANTNAETLANGNADDPANAPVTSML